MSRDTHAEADELRKRVVEAERERDEACARLVDALAREADTFGNMAELEAQAAVMREEVARIDCTCSVRERASGHLIDCFIPDLAAAVAPDAGRALLAEVVVLREVASIANDCAQGLEMGVSPSVIAQHLRQALAKVPR
jgi:hypothetical protein